MEITLLIGAARYVLDEFDARALESMIRRHYRAAKDGSVDHELLNDGGQACLLLGQVIADDLDAGFSPEPIELGKTQIRELDRILRQQWADLSHDLRTLAASIARYLG